MKKKKKIKIIIIIHFQNKWKKNYIIILIKKIVEI